MSEYSTSSGVSGNRERRPFKLITGEVTRRGKAKAGEDAADCDVAPPPKFKGKKIGGAKEIVEQNSVDATHGANEDYTIESLPGTQVASTPTTRSSRGLATDDNEHPLCAPAGWLRFWGAPHEDYKYHPDVNASLYRYCKNCYARDRGSESLVACCSQPAAEHLITFKRSEFPSTFVARHLERSRAVAEYKGLALPTSSLWFSPIPHMVHTPTESSVSHSTAPTSKPAQPQSLAKPTYSRTRDSYHDHKYRAQRAAEDRSCVPREHGVMPEETYEKSDYWQYRPADWREVLSRMKWAALFPIEELLSEMRLEYLRQVDRRPVQKRRPILSPSQVRSITTDSLKVFGRRKFLLPLMIIMSAPVEITWDILSEYCLAHFRQQAIIDYDEAYIYVKRPLESSALSASEDFKTRTMGRTNGPVFLRVDKDEFDYSPDYCWSSSPDYSRFRDRQEYELVCSMNYKAWLEYSRVKDKIRLMLLLRELLVRDLTKLCAYSILDLVANIKVPEAGI